MILKPFRPKDGVVAGLEALLATAPAPIKPKIEQEIRLVRAGNKGERESAYLIDFENAAHKNRVVLHDLRFEVNGRVAQIDHLMINRLLDVYVFETKHFNTGLKITEDGEFLRWNDYKKTFEGMPSPLAQNERHIQVLKDVFAQIEMPTRLGLRLAPSFQTLILISPNARIDRPKKFDTSRVVKADLLGKTITKDTEETSILGAFGSVAKIVSLETIQDMGRQLMLRHSPIATNYAAKFGLDKAQPQATPAVVPRQPVNAPAKPIESAKEAPKCRACGSETLSIQYGKYGYYFKCASCGGNTPVKLGCGVEGHKERLRKDGNQFFRECEGCGSSSLFFVNGI
ncbi:MAG: NERD domain-containing protein [Gammaproteobacteria bacterium]|nr:NERD domain-containing protein [Gammaproteobacteria bacterium]